MTNNNYFMFGLAGTGKDTVAEMLESQFGIQPYALADPIRGEYVRFLKSDDFKKNRAKMIEIGETYKTIYGQDVWCREALEFVEDYRMMDGQERSFLIKDGRYPMEYDFFVNQHGFIPIRLVTDDEIRLERLTKRDGDTQRKSLEFEKQHFISDDVFAHDIMNNGTMRYLLFQLTNLIEATRGN